MSPNGVKVHHEGIVSCGPSSDLRFTTGKHLMIYLRGLFWLHENSTMFYKSNMILNSLQFIIYLTSFTTTLTDSSYLKKL